METGLAALLPAGVVAVGRRTDDDPAPLFPAEEAAVRDAVAKRRAEFATVRRCARDALAALGLPPAPLVPGAGGAPTWPDGVVGSMTHCAGYRAAAVARTSTITALGIDAEPDEPLPPGVRELIGDAAELAAADNDRLLFCAKEALYKAWYPMNGRWLDFTDVRVTLAPDGTFTVDLGPFVGRWCAAGGLLLAAVWTPC